MQLSEQSNQRVSIRVARPEARRACESLVLRPKGSTRTRLTSSIEYEYHPTPRSGARADNALINRALSMRRQASARDLRLSLRSVKHGSIVFHSIRGRAFPKHSQPIEHYQDGAALMPQDANP